MMQLVLNPIFTSHMVLQADAPIRVFGTGTGTVNSETDNIHPPTKSRLAERIVQVLMK